MCLVDILSELLGGNWSEVEQSGETRWFQNNTADEASITDEGENILIEQDGCKVWSGPKSDWD